jgi:ferritin-like metal-binding protein YciE
MESLADVFEHTLQDLYYAEQALTRAIPKAQKAASHPELKAALTAHLAETKGHVKALQQVFGTLGRDASGEKCPAIDGLIAETEGVIDDASDDALDAALIGCCQAIEHYEISRYGSLREWARVLGHTEAHDLLGRQHPRSGEGGQPQADPTGGLGRQRDGHGLIAAGAVTARVAPARGRPASPAAPAGPRQRPPSSGVAA